MWMKRPVVWIVAMTSSVALIQGALADRDTPKRLLAPHKAQVKAQRGTPGPDCPDPSAVRVQVKKLSETGQRSARIRVTGTVRNRGRQHWRKRSYTDRLRLVLAEGFAGEFQGRMRTKRDLGGLAAGEAVTLSYERNWNADSHRKDFILRFNGGPQDCDRNNNRARLSAAEAKRMLGYTNTGSPNTVKLPDRSLRVSSHQLLGQGRAEVKLAFTKKTSRESIRLTTTVAEPFEGQSEPVYFSGKKWGAKRSGVATINVQVNCRRPSGAPAEVRVHYSLDTLWLALPGSTKYKSGVVKTSQTLSHRNLCLRRSQGTGAATQVR